MVEARTPGDRVAAHSVPSGEGVLDGEHEGVADVELAGDVWGGGRSMRSSFGGVSLLGDVLVGEVLEKNPREDQYSYQPCSSAFCALSSANAILIDARKVEQSYGIPFFADVEAGFGWKSRVESRHSESEMRRAWDHPQRAEEGHIDVVIVVELGVLKFRRSERGT